MKELEELGEYWRTGLIAMGLSAAAVILILLEKPYPSMSIFKSIYCLAFTLFLPGYLFTLLLFPSPKDMGLAEKLVVGVCLSIVLTGFSGILLNYTPLKLKPETFHFFMVLLTCLLALALLKPRVKSGCRVCKGKSG